MAFAVNARWTSNSRFGVEEGREAILLTRQLSGEGIGDGINVRLEVSLLGPFCHDTILTRPDHI
jgi:hypothetical protein